MQLRGLVITTTKCVFSFHRNTSKDGADVRSSGSCTGFNSYC